MIDIAELHRQSGSKKILGKFFATSGYLKAVEHLKYTGIKEADIVQKSHAHRGTVGVAKVHPLIMIEYLRWADYEAYAEFIHNNHQQ